MPGDVKFEFSGLDEALKKLQEAPEQIRRHAARGLYAEAEAVMTDSKENYVPVDTGTLRASGHVERPVVMDTGISVALGYGGPSAPYALVVHESPEMRHTRGQWKYLETPLLQATGRIRQALVSAIKGAFE